jgi:DNA repair protein RadA/Sms
VARVSTTYVCNECGTQSPVKMGRCPRCGTWGSMEARAPTLRAPNRSASETPLRHAVVERLADVSSAEARRLPAGLSEVDRVLGGGWVAGSVTLLAGEPGIGKSTLLLQLAHEALRAGRRTLYVAGEESLAQVKGRAERLGVGAELELTRETDARVLAEHLRAYAPEFVIVDSIQTLLADDSGTPGSVTQVRDATALLTQAAKEAGSALVLIGHVTKQGQVAGPKVVEHMVDATLALESASGLRVLRAMKNRFGPAGEMGVFEMKGDGMAEVANPSEAFLAERPLGVPGSAIVAALEGQRPLLLEVQALAAKSPYAAPRRTVQGLDPRRVDVVLAVLERRLELPLASLDVYVNVAGGLRLTDPGTDLAVALAVFSAVTNRPVPEKTAVVGEVGLAGELRSVAQFARRVAEAKRANFSRLVGPRTLEVTDGVPAASLAEALHAALGGGC